ncbi:hypothetical protein MYCO108962_24215 [Mycobacterium colombiense]
MRRHRVGRRRGQRGDGGRRRCRPVFDPGQRVGHPADRRHRDHGRHADDQLGEPQTQPGPAFRRRLDDIEPHRPTGRTVLVVGLTTEPHPQVARVFGLRPSQFAIGQRLVVDHQHVAGPQVDDVTTRVGRREQPDRRPRAQVQLAAARRQDQRPAGRGQGRLRRRQDRRATVHRKPFGDKRNARAPTHRDHRREVRPALAVTHQHVVEGVDEAGQPVLDQLFEVVLRQRQAAAAPAQHRGDLGGHLGRKPLLARTALLLEFDELSDAGGAGRVEAAAVAQLLEGAQLQLLVDLVAGQRRVTQCGADEFEVARDVDQGGRRAAAAEVEQPHHALVGQTEFCLHRGQRRDRVRDQPRCHTAAHEAQMRSQRVPQRLHRRGFPVRRHGDGNLRARRIRARGKHHRVQRLHRQQFRIVRGTVG